MRVVSKCVFFLFLRLRFKDVGGHAHAVHMSSRAQGVPCQAEGRVDRGHAEPEVGATWPARRLMRFGGSGRAPAGRRGGATCVRGGSRSSPLPVPQSKRHPSAARWGHASKGDAASLRPRFLHLRGLASERLRSRQRASAHSEGRKLPPNMSSFASRPLVCMPR